MNSTGAPSAPHRKGSSALSRGLLAVPYRVGSWSPLRAASESTLGGLSEMGSGSEAGSYLRLIAFCITQHRVGCWKCLVAAARGFRVGVERLVSGFRF